LYVVVLVISQKIIIIIMFTKSNKSDISVTFLGLEVSGCPRVFFFL